MEMVWSTSNLVNLGLEEDISLAIEYSKFILLDYKKVMDYLKINPLDTLKKFLKEKEIVPLLISHEYRLGLSEPTKNENIMKIYELTKELDIPFLLINPEVKPENLSFNVALEIFSKVVNELIGKINIPIVIRINANSLVNTLGKAYKLTKSNDKLFLGFDTFHFYLSGEDFDVFRDKDLSRIKFVFLKDAENIPRYYLKENQQLFPGEGIIPLIQILTYLRDGGFKDYIVLEVRRPEYEKLDPKEYISRIIEASKNLLSSF